MFPDACFRDITKIKFFLLRWVRKTDSYTSQTQFFPEFFAAIMIFMVIQKRVTDS